ncbi:hypothetical protein PT974_05485 [Cladobotryum mycophilum]|uniref:Fungal STAND N-terminal Goodbye domain-containing protein n=1 Tax=Cladobotryum mycophilum TaxID=491253 RepID=A0ABR0SJR2_9HYPO
MAADPEKRHAVPEDLKDDERDVSDLWKQALHNYKGIVGFDLERKFDNVQAMVDFGTAEMNAFHKFRHNNKKVDKLRSLFATNIDYLQKGMQQLTSAAAPAFPPAAAIGTAITYLLTAISADYDVIIVFFDDMNSFLERVVILETRLPTHRAYQNCLMDVFTSFLTVCGFAHKYIELGRFKKWISNLLVGEDSDLGGARKKMDKKLARLQNATEFAILGNSEELKKMNGELAVNQESHMRMLEAQKEVMDSIHQDTESIRNDMAKLLKAFNDQNVKREQQHKGKLSTQDSSKPASANRIRNSLPTIEGEGHEYRILKETLVSDTCSWLFSEPLWETWIKQDDVTVRPLLALIGEPGTGKSHLAATVADRLHEIVKEDASQRTCIAHFYFRGQYKDLRTVLGALIAIINQVAEQSAPLCERINAEMTRDEVTWNAYEWKDLITKILGPAFQETSPNRLFLVLDGLDESFEQAGLLELFKIIADQKLRISIVVTTRPELLTSLSAQQEVSSIQITKEKQMPDFKSLAWNRMNNLGHLRKFSRYVQQRIAEKVEEVSPTLLYAEHLLIRLDALGREGATLQALARPLPTSLHALYETLLDECQRRMPARNQQIAAKLLHWLAFSYNFTTLDEVNTLLVLFSGDNNFTLEELPEVVAKFLQLGDPGFDAEARSKANNVGSITALRDLEHADGSSDNEDDMYNDGKLPVKFKERSMRAFFLDPPAEGSTWRWHPSEAHRQIFIESVKLVQPEPLGPDKKASQALQLYAAYRLLSHWILIDPAKHSPAENVQVMEAFASAMSHTDFGEMLSKTGMVYGKNVGTSAVTDKVGVWSEFLKTPEVRSHLSDDTAAWWADVAVDPRRCRLGLAKGYLQRIYAAADADEAVKMYQLLYGVLHVTKLANLLAVQARINFPDEFSEESSGDGEEDAKEDEAKEGEVKEDAPVQTGEEDLELEKSALGVMDLFDDIPANEAAYRAVAEVLLHHKHTKAADLTCQKALDLCHESNCLQRFKILHLRAKILLKLRQKKDALHAIVECTQDIDNADVPGPLKRQAMLTRAGVEAKLKDYNAAVDSYTRAKAVDPAGMTTGDALVKELEIVKKQSDDAGFIQRLKSWSPLDRLSWLAWDYYDEADDRSLDLRSIAIREGEGEFLVDMYKGAIQFLDRLNAGAPLRVQLSMAYFYVLGDAELARKTLDEVFDSNFIGWTYAITNDAPEDTLERAVNTMSNILYEQFRASRDPTVKAEALDALKGLMKRPFPLDVAIYSPVYLMHRRIVIATMCLKMGQASEFQARLQSILEDCFAGLHDTVGWNDSLNLEKLVISALFSRLSPHADDEAEGSDSESSDSDSDSDSDSGDEDGSDGSSEEGDEAEGEGEGKGENEGEDESDDDGPSEKDGDIRNINDICWPCEGGVCKPCDDWSYWGDDTVYYCTDCSNALLCQVCYKARYEPNEAEPAKVMHFCDRKHNYIKLPVEGWQGVKDGKLRMEGEEPVDFTEFLKKLRDEVCRDAWDRFWDGA